MQLYLKINKPMNNTFLLFTILSSQFIGFMRLGPFKILEVILILWFILSLKLEIRIDDRGITTLFWLFLASFLWGMIMLVNTSLGDVVTDHLIYKPFIWNIFYFLQMLLILFYMQKIMHYRDVIHINFKMLLYVMILFQILICILQKLFFPPYDGLITGTFSEHGPLAMFIAMLVIFAHAKEIKVGWIFYTLAVGLLILTLGTRGILVFIVYFGWIAVQYAIRFFKERSSLYLISLVVFFIICLFAFFASGYYISVLSKIELYFQLVNNSDIHNIGRYASLTVTKRIFENFPLLGVGLGNYEFFRVMQPYMGNSIYLLPDYANNIFLENLAEFGLIGSFIFWRVLFKWFKQIGNKKIFCIFLLYALVSGKNDYNFWIFLGMFLIPREACHG